MGAWSSGPGGPRGAHPQDADEVGVQRGAGGRAGATELLAQVERDDPCRALLVEVVREVGQGHFAGQPRADRVGRLAVLEELRILRPSVDGRLVAGRRGRGYVSSLKSDPSSDGPTAGASRSASRLLRSWPCRIHSRSTAINRSNLILPVLGKGRRANFFLSSPVLRHDGYPDLLSRRGRLSTADRTSILSIMNKKSPSPTFEPIKPTRTHEVIGQTLATGKDRWSAMSVSVLATSAGSAS